MSGPSRSWEVVPAQPPPLHGGTTRAQGLPSSSPSPPYREWAQQQRAWVVTVTLLRGLRRPRPPPPPSDSPMLLGGGVGKSGGGVPRLWGPEPQIPPPPGSCVPQPSPRANTRSCRGGGPCPAWPGSRARGQGLLLHKPQGPQGSEHRAPLPLAARPPRQPQDGCPERVPSAAVGPRGPAFGGHGR